MVISGVAKRYIVRDLITWLTVLSVQDLVFILDFVKHLT